MLFDIEIQNITHPFQGQLSPLSCLTKAPYSRDDGMISLLAGFTAEQDPDSSVEFERVAGLEQTLSKVLLS